jgi:protein-disulfide isomerase
LRTIHDRAEATARASECANDQSAFFSYSDRVFATTDASGNVILTDSQLQQHASTLGLNTTQFNSCFPPGTSKAARVQQDVDSGLSLGVNSTPTFFIESEKVVGYQTAAQMGAIIEAHMPN